MKSLPNIEKSGFRRGEYVGYAGGRIFRVLPTTSGWQTYGQRNGATPYYFSVRTLAELSAKLSALPDLAYIPSHEIGEG